MYITATTIYYSPGPFGPLQHQGERMIFRSEDQLRRHCKNIDSIRSRRGANHIVLDTNRGLAVQVAGYSWNRGAFVDVIPMEELKPFIDMKEDCTDGNV